jgi:ubiquinone/menaquinone biosynthesis C-methylase UbiE
MVNIHHHGLTGPVLDEAAMRLFRQQWEVYRKLVDNEYIFHDEAYGVLRRVLVDEVAKPFRFLDLACGDAGAVVRALKGTQVAHYHGVDLAKPALDLARRNLDALGCELELEQGDFVEAMRARPEPADVVWIGLSLHHLATPDKRTLMSEIRGVLGEGGRFLIYEPTMPDGEERQGYLERYDRECRPLWTALTPAEYEAAMAHVRSSDLPETVSSWVALGREAGFSAVQERFKAPTDLFRLFCYHA